MTEKLVRIQLLQNAGSYVANQQVEVSEEQAKSMCTPRKRHNGHGLVDFRVAITLEELEARKKLPIDKGGLTLDEARALKIDTRIATPKEELEKPFHPGFKEVKDMPSQKQKQSKVVNE